MSKKKAGGAVRQHVSPKGKRLGIRAVHGQKVAAGAVIVRQRGTKFHPGENVSMGRDHTIIATIAGVVQFGEKMNKKTVSVSAS